MHAGEVARQQRLQRAQRLLVQINTPILPMHLGVIIGAADVQNLRDIDGAQLAPLANDELAGAAVGRASGGALERCAQSLLAPRFGDEVLDAVVERAQALIVVGRDDHGRKTRCGRFLE